MEWRCDAAAPDVLGRQIAAHMAPVPGDFLTAKIAVRLARHCRRQAERRNDLRLLHMSSTFSATGQMLDGKRAGDRELARYEGGSAAHSNQVNPVRKSRNTSRRTMRAAIGRYDDG